MENNSNSPSMLTIILGIAVIAVGAFAFFQFNSLNTIRTELADSESAGTQVASALSDSEDEGTAVADMLGEAQSAGTEVANSLSDSGAMVAELERSLGEVQSAATQSALELDEANLVATEFADTAQTEIADMQESMDAQADAQATFEAEATAQAEAMSVMEAEATAQAGMIADMVATNDAQSVMVEDAMATAQAALDLAATQSAELEAMQAAPDETVTAEKTEVPEDTEETADAETVAFKAIDFAIDLPSDFFAYDLRTDLDAAVEDFDERGFAYFMHKTLAESGTEAVVVIGASDTVVEGLADLFLAGSFPDIGGGQSMAEVMETVPENFAGPQTEIIDQAVLEDGDREIGFVKTESDFGLGSTFIQAIYIFEGDGMYYGLIYQTVETAFEDRQQAFEESAFTFVITGE